MKSLAHLPILLLLAGPASYAAGPDCGLHDPYSEIATRKITSVDDYVKLAADFIALNQNHTTRVMRLPPSFNIPVTPQNFADLAADLQKIAQTRADGVCK